MENLRDNVVSLRLTEDEKNLIDSYRDQRQLLSKSKVSRADAIIAAVKFALGKMLLK